MYFHTSAHSIGRDRWHLLLGSWSSLSCLLRPGALCCAGVMVMILRLLLISFKKASCAICLTEAFLFSVPENLSGHIHTTVICVTVMYAELALLNIN